MVVQLIVCGVGVGEGSACSQDCLVKIIINSLWIVWFWKKWVGTLVYHKEMVFLGKTQVHKLDGQGDSEFIAKKKKSIAQSLLHDFWLNFFLCIPEHGSFPSVAQPIRVGGDEGRSRLQGRRNEEIRTHNNGTCSRFVIQQK